MFLDKNCYLFSWGMELVEQRKLDYVRFGFLVAGHTKFAPDRLFAQVANSYNCRDVFTVEELNKFVIFMHIQPLKMVCQFCSGVKSFAQNILSFLGLENIMIF